MKKVKFDSHSGLAPAYVCSEPGDNTGWYYQSADVDHTFEEVHAAMDSRLNHIAAMCGHPDAAQGCRNVLDYIAAIRNGEEPLAV